MPKRKKILGISVVIIVSTIVIYFTLSYKLSEACLKDYLYEVYGGKQWVMVGKDSKYYALKADDHYMTYEDGKFKADKTREFCLQPGRNYYEGNDIIIATDKSIYKYKKDRILYTITNHSDVVIWPVSSCVNNINYVYDLEINVNGKWYAIFMYDAYSQDTKVYVKIIPGDTLEERIPINIMGFPDLEVSKSGIVYTVPNYFELRPGFYRLTHKIFLLPEDEGGVPTYITCTFKIK